MSQQAFVLRIAPGGIDMMSEALSTNELIIGWAEAEGLLDPSLSWESFRKIMSSTYYSQEKNLRKAGAASGNMWRFIREMQIGDLVITPHGSNFYIAQITENASYLENKVAADSAYRRSVLWLNNKKPIPRNIAKSALISRMKSQGTCSYATDLLEEINDCLEISSKNEKPTFQADLQSRLIKETLDELRSGRIDSYGFESLIKTLLNVLGAKSVRIVPRQHDRGADVVATFLVAGTFSQVVAVQAKHWQANPPVGKEVVSELIRGIDAESADLGIVITSGSISDEARLSAKEFYEERGIKIELVDGEQFAKLIVEHGVTPS
jgi:predicted Mrr-cat superfamily restriction endonuclease